MRVYLDSSALLKRAVEERESEAFESALTVFVAEGATVLTSDLALVEVTRALRSRLDSERPRELGALVDETLSGIFTSPIGEQVISIARRLGPSTLRSLDAIHLATATLLDADLVVAYDRRMLTAAAELGFATASPGAEAELA